MSRQKSDKPTVSVTNLLDRDALLRMVNQGDIDEVINVLGQSHSRLATILRFRLDKINADERQSVISPRWAERYRNEMISELREQAGSSFR